MSSPILACAVILPYILLSFGASSGQCLDTSSQPRPLSDSLINVTSNSSLAEPPLSCRGKHKFQLAKVAASLVCIISGLFILVIGYGRRRVSFFLVGAISGTLTAYFICTTQADISSTVTIIGSGASGLIVSLFTTLVLYCGYFVVGLLAGSSLSIGVLLIVTAFHMFNSISLPCVIVVSVCVVQIFVTLWWRRVLLIVSSSMVGSTFVICGVDYFVENFFLLGYIELKVFYGKNFPLCWHNYVLLTVWVLLVAGGILVQLFVTGKVRQDKQYVFVYRTRTPHGRSKGRDENQGLVCAELSNV